jgi:hypothetical protein
MEGILRGFILLPRGQVRGAWQGNAAGGRRHGFATDGRGQGSPDWLVI